MMKFYMSYWTAGNYIDINYKTNNDFIKNKELMSLTVNFVKKNHKEIHFITDSLGKEQFKDLGWTSIYTHLDELPKNYSSVWSLGKIKAYFEIAKKGDPFIHIDHDFFITRPLEKEVLESEIIVEDREYIPSYGYNIEYFENNCPNLFLAKNIKIDFAYRCGLIGGNNLFFFFDYASSALKLIFNDQNKNFFLKPLEEHKKINANFHPVNKSTLIEQYYLAASLKKWNKNPKIFWEKSYTELFAKTHNLKGIGHGNCFYSPLYKEFLQKTGCFHPYGTNKYLFKERYEKDLLLLI